MAAFRYQLTNGDKVQFEARAEVLIGETSATPTIMIARRSPDN